MPFLPTYKFRVVFILILIGILEVISMLYHLSANISNTTSIVLVCTLWISLIVFSAMFCLLALKFRQRAVIYMGIVGFMLILVNTVIDFLLFWDNGLDSYVIPCSAISILILLQIPTVINYNVLLYMFLWSAHTLGTLLILSLTGYFHIDFILALIIMIFSLAVLAQISSYQSFRKMKAYYFGILQNSSAGPNTGFQRIAAASPLG